MTLLFENNFFKGNFMNRANNPVERIKLGLAIVLLATLSGCATYGNGGYYYGDAVVVPGPDLLLFNDDYGSGRYEYDYRNRGSESRREAHPESRAAAQPQSRVAAASESRGAARSGGGKGRGR
jgi:hypothetical protein